TRQEPPGNACARDRPTPGHATRGPRLRSPPDRVSARPATPVRRPFHPPDPRLTPPRPLETRPLGTGHQGISTRKRLVMFALGSRLHVIGTGRADFGGEQAMKVLGVNAVFHDPAAALGVDGRIVAAAEEERCSRRKHGKEAVPFSTWELPIEAMRWCLSEGGLTPSDLDVVTYSYDPALALEDGPGLDPVWEQLRTIYVERAPHFLTTALPGLDPEKVTYVPHHVAHAASAALAAPPAADGRGDRAVFVADGRGESTSHLAGSYSEDGHLDVLAHQPLRESLGLVYEELTQHLGFRRSSDEYKVMALASYLEPTMSELLKDRIAYQGDGLIVASDVDWDSFAPPKQPGQEHTRLHADLAASVQH